jgi:hypothetical protein
MDVGGILRALRLRDLRVRFRERHDPALEAACARGRGPLAYPGLRLGASLGVPREPSSKTAALARRQPQSCHDETEAEERAQALLPLTRCGSPRPFRRFVIFTDSLAADLWDRSPDPDVGAAPSGTRDGLAMSPSSEDAGQRALDWSSINY